MGYCRKTFVTWTPTRKIQFNPLIDDKIFHLCKLKAFADGRRNEAQIMKFVPKKVKNFVRKEKMLETSIFSFPHDFFFFFFSKCFLLRVIKGFKILSFTCITGRHTRQAEPKIAFSSYIDHVIRHIGINSIIPFDKVLINDGGAYNPITGRILTFTNEPWQTERVFRLLMHLCDSL